MGRTEGDEGFYDSRLNALGRANAAITAPEHSAGLSRL